jgi:predicted secreted protein
MTKPTFGSAFAHSLGGQKLGTFSANGHVSAEQLADLQTAFNSDAPIAFSLQIGDAAGATDAGIYSGDCVLSSFEITASADGEWDWSIEAQTSGDVTYAPATP